MSETPAQRAIARIETERRKLKLTQTDIANRLGWPQPRLSNLLNGKTDLRVNDLDALCFAVDIRLTEAVRDHGMEFCAEMSPTELRFLEMLRKLTPAMRDAYLTVLLVAQDDARRALPVKSSKRRLA